jgi:hypothetical protein
MDIKKLQIGHLYLDESGRCYVYVGVGKDMVRYFYCTGGVSVNINKYGRVVNTCLFGAVELQQQLILARELMTRTLNAGAFEGIKQPGAQFSMDLGQVTDAEALKRQGAQAKLLGVELPEGITLGESNLDKVRPALDVPCVTEDTLEEGMGYITPTTRRTALANNNRLKSTAQVYTFIGRGKSGTLYFAKSTIYLYLVSGNQAGGYFSRSSICRMSKLNKLVKMDGLFYNKMNCGVKANFQPSELQWQYNQMVEMESGK